jgi:hypothetical protein
MNKRGRVESLSELVGDTYDWPALSHHPSTNDSSLDILKQLTDCEDGESLNGLLMSYYQSGESLRAKLVFTRAKKILAKLDIWHSCIRWILSYVGLGKGTVP